MTVGPSLILTNGKIYPRVTEPQTHTGLIIQDGRIAGVFDGPPDANLGRAPTFDLGGRVVLPGLTDAHLHFQKYALQLNLVDCETDSLDECLQRVQARSAQVPAGEWILGHGWNQTRWERFGRTSDLDAVAPAHPVYLTAKSLHAGWANSEALRRAGVSASTQDPNGGRIQRGDDGAPTGILLESAMSLVAAALPEPGLSDVVGAMLAAQQRLWSMGITGVHDFDGPRSFQALQILLEQGRLDLRVLKSIPHELLSEAAAVGLRSGFGSDWLRLGHVKLFADGALGPRTAAMLAPYDGEPGNTGLLMLDRETVLETGIRAAEAGLALAVHAIGDRANHEVLDGLAALREYEVGHGLPARRHRIEHLQLLHPGDLSRPAQLAVTASMQPVHATSDMLMADRYWGGRAEFSYAWSSQIRAGANLAFGSDAPVESPNPFLGLHAAVTRRRLDGSPSPEGWIPQQRLTVQQALSGFTEGAAFVAGAEHEQGRLEPGYLADLIVLDRNPLTCPPDDLPQMRVLGTMVGGRWVRREF